MAPATPTVMAKYEVIGVSTKQCCGGDAGQVMRRESGVCCRRHTGPAHQDGGGLHPDIVPYRAGPLTNALLAVLRSLRSSWESCRTADRSLCHLRRERRAAAARPRGGPREAGVRDGRDNGERSYGAGDAVLREVGVILSRLAEEVMGGVAARMGGEDMSMTGNPSPPESP